VARQPGAGHGGTVRHTGLSGALATAEHLAQEAGRLQVRERATLTVHGWKAHANDLVSDVDLASERLIADGLRAAFPALRSNPGTACPDACRGLIFADSSVVEQ
jgi:hypothetical protein